MLDVAVERKETEMRVEEKVQEEKEAVEEAKGEAEVGGGEVTLLGAESSSTSKRRGGGSASEGGRGGNTGEVSGAQRTSMTCVSSLGTYVMDFGKHRGKALSEILTLVIAVTHSLNRSRILEVLAVATCVLVNLRVLKFVCSTSSGLCERASGFRSPALPLHSKHMESLYPRPQAADFPR